MKLRSLIPAVPPHLLLFICFGFALPVTGQIRLTKLNIEPKSTFKLETSDILVVDTLIMQDSSRILLNSLTPENYIRASIVIIHTNCIIDGRGKNGSRGRDGRKGVGLHGPCSKGTNGRDGAKGLDGTSGVNLFLYIDSLKILGSLQVDLRGGNGGDGGDGGAGGGGGQGTIHCSGGDGGQGGNGGVGGNGGSGGKLFLDHKTVKQMRHLIGDRVKVLYNGGSYGYGGVLGAGGAQGLGPKGKNGKRGQRGVDGHHGRSGDMGTILFEQ